MFTNGTRIGSEKETLQPSKTTCLLDSLADFLMIGSRNSSCAKDRELTANNSGRTSLEELKKVQGSEFIGDTRGSTSLGVVEGSSMRAELITKVAGKVGRLRSVGDLAGNCWC